MKRSLCHSIPQKIAVAMSGGVDSSVAAYLLKRASDGIFGIYMANWDDPIDGTKCWEVDYNDARRVSDQLEIPLYHTNFAKEYWNLVFEPMCHDLTSSSSCMPNPDISCNRHIKFGVLKNYIWDRFRPTAMATGHYARLWDPTSSGQEENSMPLELQQVLEEGDSSMLDDLLDLNRPTLLAARDLTKDQSYFLCGVSATAFEKVLFPLGDLMKNNSNDTNPNNQENRSVREIAHQAKLYTANKRESMGICFIGKQKTLGHFLHQYLPPPTADTTTDTTDTSTTRKSTSHNNAGQFINVEDGTIVGTFDLDGPKVYTTIGQGVKIGGAVQKWFAVDKLSPTQIVVCPGTHHPALYAQEFVVHDLNFISSKIPQAAFRAHCRIRHLQPLVPCTVLPVSSSSWRIMLDGPVRGITPGQVAALYIGGQGLICLGGGPIVERGPNFMRLNLDVPKTSTIPKTLCPAGQDDNHNACIA